MQAKEKMKTNFPQMIRITQKFDNTVLEDIPAEMGSQINHWNFENAVQRGQTVAVACSSRGIANYDIIVKAVISDLKNMGLSPFIVPAMGSHGAASGAGQKRVLEHLGIREEKVGAPIKSALEVIQIGNTDNQIPVYLDKQASKADHVVLINRIKKHTDFEHEFESGLLKMMAIGLGKQEGAATYHEAMMTYGYPEVILSVARQVMQHVHILFGVGIVENGYGQTADIRICPADKIEEMEKDLLSLAKSMAPSLPFDEADILIIDEMGKEISGTGFDTKVVGRIGLPLVTPEPKSPKIKRLLVCDLTAETEGNALGVGIADMITQRLLDKIDIQTLNINTITGACPEVGKIPLTLKNDREALEIAIKSVGLIPRNRLKMMRIKNTAFLSEVDVSEAYKKELSGRGDLEISLNQRPMTFDQKGNFESFLII
jgi:hypothetical protein